MPHAWTNGFVERLQGTILDDPWRVEFRSRFFTRAVAMQTALDHYLQFHNRRRVHQGYRTKGQMPAGTFFERRDKHEKPQRP